MSRSLTEAVDRLRAEGRPPTAKTGSYGGSVLRALAASVRAAPLRPVTASDFHAVKQADWAKVADERAELGAKLAAAKTARDVTTAAVRLAGIDELAARRDKIASAVVVTRALTILQRGST